jgi:hypothetical protein
MADAPYRGGVFSVTRVQTSERGRPLAAAAPAILCTKTVPARHNTRLTYMHENRTNKQTKQNKTKQNKTKQNKTKQNKTKQNKTEQQNKTNPDTDTRIAHEKYSERHV